MDRSTLVCSISHPPARPAAPYSASASWMPSRVRAWRCESGGARSVERGAARPRAYARASGSSDASARRSASVAHARMIATSPEQATPAAMDSALIRPGVGAAASGASSSRANQALASRRCGRRLQNGDSAAARRARARLPRHHRRRRAPRTISTPRADCPTRPPTSPARAAVRPHRSPWRPPRPTPGSRRRAGRAPPRPPRLPPTARWHTHGW